MHSLIVARNFPAAISRLENERRLCAPKPELLDLLARAYLGSQKLEKAYEVASALVEIKPQSTDALVLKGNLQYLLAHDDEAEETFRKAIYLQPKSEEPRYALGRMFYQIGRPEKAKELFESILTDYPKSYRSWDNLGLCQEALGEKEQASKSYLRSIALVTADHPEYEWPYVNLANLLISENQPRRAFDLAVTAAERNPSSAKAYFLAGKALTFLNQQERSIRWFQRSAELDPSSAEPHYLLGQVLRKMGKIEESKAELETFKKLLAVQPGRKR